MALNKDLLFTTMEYIERHPEQWDQGAWGEVTECGTVGCFAGWATMLNNPAHAPAPDGDSWLVEDRFVQHHARDILGLDDEQVEVLFSAYRTMDDLRALVILLGDTDGAATRGQMYEAIDY